ncbi:hypothetical protein UACE39S_01435 [Ureibacillus acetophenoni]
MNKLFSKFLSFSFGSWVNAVLGIVSIPLITRLVSIEEYGQLSLFALSLNILLLVVSLGMDYSFVRFYYEEKNPQNLLKFCLKWPLLLFSILAILIWISKDLVSTFLINRQDNFLILLLILTLFFQLLNRFAFLLIRMKHRAKLFSLLTMSTKIIELLIILFCLNFVSNFFLLILIAQSTSIILITILALLLEKVVWVSIIKKSSSESFLINEKQEIYKYAIPFIPSTMVTWLFEWVDRISLRSISTFEEIGIYSAAFKVVAILSIIQYSFSMFWTPVSFERYNKNPEDTNFFKNINDLISIIMFTIAVLVILLKDVIVLLLGQDFQNAVYIMPFLIFIPIMFTLSETTVIGINFIKKTYWHIIIATISCVTNIIGNLFFIPELGAKGAAISTSIAYIVFFSLRTFISKKYIKVKFSYFKIYTSISLLFLYCFYTSFYTDSIYITWIGILLLIYLFIIYRTTIVLFLSFLIKRFG